MMGLWVVVCFMYAFSYSILAVYTSANFINVCAPLCACDIPSIDFIVFPPQHGKKENVASDCPKEERKREEERLGVWEMKEV